MKQVNKSRPTNAERDFNISIKNINQKQPPNLEPLTAQTCPFLQNSRQARRSNMPIFAKYPTKSSLKHALFFAKISLQG